ncbi:unnamed protein product [Tetraodon nigroviridis]|uniref:(spotted green pufferfish) hypothetical protein n=1 Tax=Tetraodon nigroviridis TaxID=99883 RepID=Q4SAV6_TETNG|nr:unnamed protein product [Tetraodon nigroviridis]
MVIEPGHNGEDCDGDSRQHSEGPDRSPERRRMGVRNLRATNNLEKVRFYRPEWRHKRSQTVVSRSPENSLKTRTGRSLGQRTVWRVQSPTGDMPAFLLMEDLPQTLPVQSPAQHGNHGHREHHVKGEYSSSLRLIHSNELFIDRTCHVRVQSDQSGQHRGDSVSGLQDTPAAFRPQKRRSPADICVFSPSTLLRQGRSSKSKHVFVKRNKPRHAENFGKQINQSPEHTWPD